MGDNTTQKPENVIVFQEIKKQLDDIEERMDMLDKNLNRFEKLCRKYFKNFPKELSENKPGIPRS